MNIAECLTYIFMAICLRSGLSTSSFLHSFVTFSSSELRGLLLSDTTETWSSSLPQDDTSMSANTAAAAADSVTDGRGVATTIFLISFLCQGGCVADRWLIGWWWRCRCSRARGSELRIADSDVRCSGFGWQKYDQTLHTDSKKQKDFRFRRRMPLEEMRISEVQRYDPTYTYVHTSRYVTLHMTD